MPFPDRLLEWTKVWRSSFVAAEEGRGIVSAIVSVHVKIRFRAQNY
jgi:hypothetical protein